MGTLCNYGWFCKQDAVRTQRPLPPLQSHLTQRRGQRADGACEPQQGLCERSEACRDAEQAAAVNDTRTNPHVLRFCGRRRRSATERWHVPVAGVRSSARTLVVEKAKGTCWGDSKRSHAAGIGLLAVSPAATNYQRGD